jgi:hypothetical protein
MDSNETAPIERVYLAYARTMHAVQRLERTHLNIAAMTQAAKGIEEADSGPAESIFEDAKRWVDGLQGAQKTLGAAFAKVYGSIKNPDFHTILKDTRSLRDALAHRFLVDSNLGTDQGRHLALEELAEREQCFHKMCETTLAMLRKALTINGANHKFVDDAIAWIDPGGPH